MKKMTLKSITRMTSLVFPVILIVGGFIYLQVIHNKSSKQFYEMRINSIVINHSDWQKRSIDFQLENGITLNFIAPAKNKLIIGDSIQKNPSTYIYAVFRKDEDGVYKYWASYDFRKMY